MVNAPVLRVWDIDAPHLPNAACREMDAALFTGPEDGAPPEQVREAKRVCARCPERIRCLAYAIARPGDYRDPDIWGGTTHLERQEMRRQIANAERRTRRRARKEATA